MANDKSFKIKNGLQAGRYLQTGGAETAGSEYYSLGSASYDSVSYDSSVEGTNIGSIYIKPDGTKLYANDGNFEGVLQYSMSTAWDLSTLSYDSVSFSVATQTGTRPQSLSFKTDGTKFYVVSTGNDTVFQYSLSTAWDLSTASYDSVSFSVSSQGNEPYGLTFKYDGTKMYISDLGNDFIYQYTLSTAWDLSTASYDSVSLDVSSYANISTVIFSPDGTQLIASSITNQSIVSWSLSTAWDITTATFESEFSNLAESNPRGLYWKDDGTKLYVSDNNVDKIYQYSTVAYTQTLDLSTGSYFSFTPSGATTVSFTNAPASGKAVGFAVEINGDGSAVTWPSSVKWHGGTAQTATASKEVYAFVTTDGGTTYYGKRAGGNIT